MLKIISRIFKLIECVGNKNMTTLNLIYVQMPGVTVASFIDED